MDALDPHTIAVADRVVVRKESDEVVRIVVRSHSSVG